MSSTSKEVLEYLLGGTLVPLRRYWSGCGAFGLAFIPVMLLTKSWLYFSCLTFFGKDAIVSKTFITFVLDLANLREGGS